MKTKKLIPLPRLLKNAQEVFNRHIRLRDQNLGCISCGGEVNHAGHYHSQGANSALRFNEMNTNGQCVSCNTYKHGNLIHYRQGLVKRYGEQKVKELELSAQLNRVKKWSRTELEWIILTYSPIKAR